VASDPTVSRTIAALAADAATALAALNAARAAARSRVWALAGEHAPDAGIDADNPIAIDTDATLLTAHSDKQGAAPTFKRGYGFHPLWAFADHGADGTGEPLAVMLRPGNAGSNTAADHIAVVRDALKQLPSYRPGTRPGRKVLIRADSAGCTQLTDDTAELKTSLDSGEPNSQSRLRLLRTSSHTSISAKGPPTTTTHEPVTTAESVTYKRFCSPVAIHEQSQLEISGFGVRVPGGAQKPRSRECPGPRCVCCVPFTSLFASVQLRAEPSLAVSRRCRERSSQLSDLHLIVTVRHITSVRIVAVFSDSPPRPALSSQPSYRLEA
jgi:hypothetical protein